MPATYVLTITGISPPDLVNHNITKQTVKVTTGGTAQPPADIDRDHTSFTFQGNTGDAFHIEVTYSDTFGHVSPVPAVLDGFLPGSDGAQMPNVPGPLSVALQA